MLWNKSDLIQAVNVKESCLDFYDFDGVNGVCIDSRSVQKDDLFIAIIGDVNDGHKYVKQALEQGASACLVQYVPDDVDESKLIIVEDSFDALWDLARYRRAQIKGKLVLITGSVGKTTTKEMTACALSGQGGIHSTIGNLNNQYGLPLSLSRATIDSDYVVLEVGMNHADEISPLSVLAKPDICVITTVEAVHIEFFDSVEEIADAKSEIFDGMSSDSIAILNRDNRHYLQVKENAKKRNLSKLKSFGQGEESEFRLIKNNESALSQEVEAVIEGNKVKYTLNFKGLHMALNSVCVLGVVSSIGASVEIAIDNLRSLQPKEGRGQLSKISFNGNEINVLDETYNASPVAMKAALKVLGNVKLELNIKVVAVLGDMAELGENTINYHKDLAQDVIKNNIDILVTVGDNMKYLYDACADTERYHFNNSDEIIDGASNFINNNDYILVKGSRSMKMENFVNQLKRGQNQ